MAMNGMMMGILMVIMMTILSYYVFVYACDEVVNSADVWFDCLFF